MSVAGRILKLDKARLLFNQDPALKSFQRFLADPVKKPGTAPPPSTPKPAAAAAKPSIPVQKPQPTTPPKPQPQQTPVSKAPVPPQTAGPITNQRPTSNPASSPVTPPTPASTPGSKVAAASTIPTSTTASKVAHATPASTTSAPKVAPSVQRPTPPPGTPPPTSGSKNVKPREWNRRNVLLAAAATAGLASIFYWQYSSSKSAQGPAKQAVLKNDVNEPKEDEKHDLETPTKSEGDGTAGGTLSETETLVADDRKEEDGEASIEDKQGSETTAAIPPPEPEVNPDSSRGDEESLKIVVRSSPDASAFTVEATPSTKEDAGSQTEALIVVVEPEPEPEPEPDEPKVDESVLLQKSHEANVEIFQREPAAEPASGSPASSPLDVVAAIHAAEQRQAQIDAALYKEELQKAEERHQNALKAAQLETATYATQMHLAEKGLLRESLKYAEDLRAKEEEAEKRLQAELKAQEEAAQKRVEEAELAAKASALTTLAEERADFVKDIGNIKLKIEAMNLALNATSELAREGHTVNKLSLGAFALEDALHTGAPVANDVSFILETAGGDPLVEVVLRSLPKQVIERGTLTPLQLDQLLEDSKQTMKQLALIPARGGGILTHLLASIAASLKFAEHGVNEGDGVEAIISAVEHHVKNGELKDAADVLEKGLSGTCAEKLAAEWAKHARNRVILEQVCSLLRAHTAAIALAHTS